MDFSDNQKDKLKKLAELYEREDVTDSQYRSIYRENFSEIDASKDSPENESSLTNQSKPGQSKPEEKNLSDESASEIEQELIAAAPEPRKKKSKRRSEPSEEDDSNRPSIAEMLSSDTLEGTRQPTVQLQPKDRPRQPAPAPISAAEQNRRRHSLFPKQSIDPSQVPTGTGRHPVVRETSGSSSSLNSVVGSGKSGTRMPTISPRRRLKMSTLMIAPAVFGMGLAIAIGITRAGSTPVEPIKPPKPPEVVEVPLKDNEFVELMFGVPAVERCSVDCGAQVADSDRKVCYRACKRLLPTVFGRRITLDKLDPAADAKQAINRCLSKETVSDTFNSEEQWQENIKAAVAALRRLTPAEEANRGMINAAKRLHLPPSGDKEKIALTEHVLRSLCLRAHQTVAHVGLEQAQKNSDDFSTDYYQKFESAVESAASLFESKKPSMANKS